VISVIKEMKKTNKTNTKLNETAKTIFQNTLSCTRWG